MFECPYYRTCPNVNSKYEDGSQAERSDSFRQYMPYDYKSGSYFNPDDDNKISESYKRGEIIFKNVKIESLED